MTHDHKIVEALRDAINTSRDDEGSIDLYHLIDRLTARGLMVTQAEPPSESAPIAAQPPSNTDQLPANTAQPDMAERVRVLEEALQYYAKGQHYQLYNTTGPVVGDCPRSEADFVSGRWVGLEGYRETLEVETGGVARNALAGGKECA